MLLLRSHVRSLVLAGHASGDRTQLLQGTPGYMAPEVLQAAISGRGGYDLCIADVWSVGVCLYCLFNQTGLPFKGKDARELLRNVTMKSPPTLLHLSRNGTPTYLEPPHPPSPWGPS